MSNPDYTPKPGTKVKLNDYDPEGNGDLDKDTAAKESDRLRKRLETLQEMMYAESKQALLCVFQAMDTGGKDSTVRRVFGGLTPLGTKVAAFKAPSAEELAHDFLWRVHQQVPPKGLIGIFNRSHYEDVLVVRVNGLVAKEVWQQRYEQINQFERLLVETGTRIIKFYLHISKAEQKERLQDRLNEPEKHWKFSLGDLPVREKWDDYMAAYEDAITHCNTDYAPWVIVPANRKWVRDLVVLRKVVQTLEAMDLKYPEPEPGLDKVVIPD